MYQRQSKKAPQYISSEGEERPSDNSDDEEWEDDEMDLNAVAIGNMSIDSKAVAKDGERGRYREIQLTQVLENQWRIQTIGRISI